MASSPSMGAANAPSSSPGHSVCTARRKVAGLRIQASRHAGCSRPCSGGPGRARLRQRQQQRRRRRRRPGTLRRFGRRLHVQSHSLETGLPVRFNGNSVQTTTLPILEFTAPTTSPTCCISSDRYVESRFQYDAVGCTGNSGCCPQRGWSGPECGCLGAMQTGPVCQGTSTLGLLPDGHVDLDEPRRLGLC